MDDIVLAPGAYIVAVSGGVDSVVLLDIATRQPGVTCIVAHFDHGIRTDSAEDAAFVKKLSEQYGCQFVSERVELGSSASEEKARHARYDFLTRMTKKYNARLVTAHHADDVIETVAINLIRGTGWRGLAVFGRSDIIRPLVDIFKDDIMAYAKARKLSWREDSTNSSDQYLRNTIRRQLKNVTKATKQEIVSLFHRQTQLKKAVDDELHGLLPEDVDELPRHIFTMIDTTTANELLRAACVKAGGASPTRPQRERALLAIKAQRAGTVHEMGDGFRLSFSRAGFTITK